MIYKHELLALQQEVLAYAPACEVVACETTALLVYGLLDSVDHACFDVGSTLFEAVAKSTQNFVGTVDGRRMIRFNDRVSLHEGHFMGVTSVDGIRVYGLDGMRVRYEARGRSDKAGYFAARVYANDIAKLQQELAAPKPAPVEPVKATQNWGVLTEDEQVFEEHCKKADWYYSYSDDSAVYRNGKAECEALDRTAKQQGGNYSLIYKYYSTR